MNPREIAGFATLTLDDRFYATFMLPSFQQYSDLKRFVDDAVDEERKQTLNAVAGELNFVASRIARNT